MKKTTILLLAIGLTMGSCTSGEQFHGVMAGGMLGGVFGSSIGGLLEGPRGSHAGNIVGTVIGGAVGAAATAPKTQRKGSSRNDDDGIDSYNRRSKTQSASEARSIKQEYSDLQIENLRFIDDNNNRIIDAGESCKIEFEIHNKGNATIHNIAPVITANDKNIIISPTAIVTSIAPGRGVRYAAEVYGRPKLRTGEADFRLGFAKGDLIYTVRTFQISTQGR